jgi:hypothetical protein
MSESQPRIRSTCDACQIAKLRCSRNKPRCRRCQNLNRECVYSASRPIGRPRRAPAEGPKGDDTAQQPNTFPTRGTTPEAQLARLLLTGTELGTESVSSSGHATSPSVNTSSANIGPNNDLGDSLIWEGPHFPDPTMDFSSALHGLDFSSLMETAANLVPHTSAGLGEDTAYSWDTESGPTIDQIGSEAIYSTRSSDVDLPISPSQEFRPTSQRNEASEIQSQSQSMPLDIEPLHLSPINDLGTLPPLKPAYDVPLSPYAGTPLAATSIPDRRKRDLEGGCDCYPTVLQRMYQLNSSYVRDEISTIDQIMRLEKDIRSEVVRLLLCEPCSGNRQRVLLLTSTIMETTVDILENDLADEMEASGHSIFKGLHGPLQSQHHARKYSKSHPSVACREETTLKLGTYEIDGEEKKGFLSYLIRTRLKELSGTLRQLHTTLQQTRQTSNTKAASIIVVDAFQRLHNLIRRLDH